jgi:hypothetical protein
VTPTTRVLALVLADLPDRDSAVEVLEVPPNWDNDDIDRYTNSRHDWVTASVTYVQPIPEEGEQT